MTNQHKSFSVVILMLHIHVCIVVNNEIKEWAGSKKPKSMIVRVCIQYTHKYNKGQNFKKNRHFQTSCKYAHVYFCLCLWNFILESVLKRSCADELIFQIVLDLEEML